MKYRVTGLYRREKEDGTVTSGHFTLTLTSDAEMPALYFDLKAQAEQKGREQIGAPSFEVTHMTINVCE